MDFFILDNEIEMFFFFVVWWGYKDIVVFLFKDIRIEVNYVDLRDLMLFYVVCFSGDCLLCELFLKYGVDLIVKIKNWFIGLYFVVYNGDDDICELFVFIGKF